MMVSSWPDTFEVPTLRDFTEGIAKSLGSALTGDEQLFLRDEGALADYAGDEAHRAQIAERAAATIRRMRRHFATGTPIPVPSADEDEDADQRWAVLRDLDAAFRSQAPDGDALPPWEEITVVGGIADYSREPFSNQITIRFDARMQQRDLIAAIRRMWPTLRDQNLIRPSRRFSDRSAMLVRFVCLEAPDASWRDRLARWNETYPDQQFPGVQQFERAFRRAEKQLTGESHGAEFFYDKRARLSIPELRELADAGDPDARSRLDRIKTEVGAVLLRAYMDGTEAPSLLSQLLEVRKNTSLPRPSATIRAFMRLKDTEDLEAAGFFQLLGFTEDVARRVKDLATTTEHRWDAHFAARGPEALAAYKQVRLIAEEHGFTNIIDFFDRLERNEPEALAAKRALLGASETDTE